MNPEKLKNLDSNTSESEETLGTFEYVQPVDFSTQSRLEKTENAYADYYNKLQTIVESIPNDSPQKTEAVGILETINKKMSDKLRVLILAISVLTPLAPSQGAAAETTWPITTTERSAPASEITESLKALQDKVWTDNFETGVLYFGEEGEEEKIVEFQGEKDATNMQTSQNQQEDGILKIFSILERENIELGNPETGSLVKITQHNHPVELLAARYNLTNDQIEKMQSGEAPSIVLPPSTVDLFTAHQRVENINYVGQVAEPSGTWTYQEDRNHPVVQIVQQETEDDMQHLNNYSAKTTEYKEMNGVVLSVVGLQILEIEEKVVERYGFSYEETFLSIINLGEEIREKSASGEDVSDLIKQYIGQASILGMNIEYRPH